MYVDEFRNKIKKNKLLERRNNEGREEGGREGEMERWIGENKCVIEE